MGTARSVHSASGLECFCGSCGAWGQSHFLRDEVLICVGGRDFVDGAKNGDSPLCPLGFGAGVLLREIVAPGDRVGSHHFSRGVVLICVGGRDFGDGAKNGDSPLCPVGPAFRDLYWNFTCCS
jgi:hypothetical protein